MHASSQHAQQTHEWRGGKMNTPFKQNICRCRYAFCCGNLCVSHSYKYIYTTINIEYHIIMWRRMCERQQLLGTWKQNKNKKMYILLIVPFEYKLAVGFYAYTLYITYNTQPEQKFVIFFFYFWFVESSLVFFSRLINKMLLILLFVALPVCFPCYAHERYVDDFANNTESVVMDLLFCSLFLLLILYSVACSPGSLDEYADALCMLQDLRILQNGCIVVDTNPLKWQSTSSNMSFNYVQIAKNGRVQRSVNTIAR